MSLIYIIHMYMYIVHIYTNTNFTHLKVVALSTFDSIKKNAVFSEKTHFIRIETIN